MGKVKRSAKQALYRVHRSRDFKEVVGQDHVVKTLQRAVTNGQIAHAYLFTGPRGVGKTSVARILAHAINDLPYSGEDLQLDVIEIDAASNRGIDEIRELREKVHIAPSAAKYKVYIIDEVHMLTAPAFNALLKTLEEPPSHVVFVLATTEPHKIPETIVSRTQRFAFKPIAKEQAADHIRAIAKKEGVKLEEQAAELIAEHAGGALRDAIGFLDQLSGNEQVTATDVEQLLGLAPAKKVAALKVHVLSGDIKDMLSELDRLLAEGASPAQVAMQLIDDLRQDLRAGQALAATLIDDLLAVTTSREPGLKLEAVLARTCLEAGQPSSAKQQQGGKSASRKAPESTPQPASKPKPKPKAAENEIKQAQSDDSLPKNASTLPTRHWREILAAVKSQNNSLYAVLRLAKPEQADDRLVLSFAFPFHATRAEEARSKELLADVLNDVLGREVSVVTKLDKSLQEDNRKEPDTVTSVIGLMGGGAIVEYEDG